MGMRREEWEAIKTVTEMNIEGRRSKKKWMMEKDMRTVGVWMIVGDLGRGRPQIDKGEGRTRV